MRNAKCVMRNKKWGIVVRTAWILFLAVTAAVCFCMCQATVRAADAAVNDGAEAAAETVAEAPAKTPMNNGVEVQEKAPADAKEKVPADAQEKSSSAGAAADAGAEVTAEEAAAVSEVQKNLKKNMSRNYPWYDEKSDSLQPVKLPADAVTQQTQTYQTEKRNYSAFTSVMKGLVYVMLAILAGVVLAGLSYWGYKTWDNWISGNSKLTEADENARRRTEALPEEIQAMEGDFARLARLAYEKGDFRLAIIYLFSLQLTKLDEFQRIHLLKGRTNRQYQKSLKRSLKRQFTEHYEAISINATDQQREVWERYRQLGRQAEDAFAETMFLFEETFFGERTPQKESVDACFLHTEDMITALAALDKRVKKEHSPWKLMPQSQVAPVYLPGMDVRRTRCWWVLATLAGLLSLTGCEKTINTDYGRINSYNGNDSVVGTKVFADILREQGCKVSVEGEIKRRKLNRRDTVVWFIRSWDDISPEAYLWAEEWLEGGTPGNPRKMLMVYRAFDGVRVYYDHMIPLEKDPEQRRMMREWHDVPYTSRYYWRYDDDMHIDRWVECEDLGREAELEYFATDESYQVKAKRKIDAEKFAQQKVTRLTGDKAWLARVRVEDADLWSMNQMQLHDNIAGGGGKGIAAEMQKLMKNAFEQTFSDEKSPVRYDEVKKQYAVKTEDGKEFTLKNPLGGKPLVRVIEKDALQQDCRGLLFSQDKKPFLAERVYRDADGEVVGRWYAAANGSFLLNSMLVNHENRRLAFHMAELVGGNEKRVVFLETTAQPHIYEGREEDEGEKIMPAGWEMFEVFPLNFILFHVTALTMFYIFYLLPIFGRAKRIFVPGGSRFGEHVRAVGRLLRRQ